jgi:DNA-binding MurR/RpiR family transcriptional regulator
MKQIDERLRAHYAQLTPQEQRVTDFIFDHFDDLISYNSAELARLSGVSKATVSRLFKRLGYASYREMREEVRTLRQSGMPLTITVMRCKGTLYCLATTSKKWRI